MSRYKRHFFICQVKRPSFAPKPSCGGRGSDEIIQAFAMALSSQPDLAGEVRVTTSGCLGNCDHGPSIVVYPEGTWYAPVTPEAAQEIIEKHLIGGQVVEHLVYRWPHAQE